MEFISPHKCIKNTSAILTEQLLNTSRGPWTPKKKDPHKTRQDKRKKKGKGRGEEARQDLHPWQAAEGERRFPHLGMPPHWWGYQLGENRSLVGLRGEPSNQSVAAGQNETYTDGMCHSLVHPSLKGCLPVHMGAGCWNMGFREQTQGRNCCGCEETA